MIFGSADGLAASGSQYWDQDVSGIADQAETCDNFGFSLSAADFNADGFKDLVIGVPNEDIGSEADVGAVHVLYGSMTGLTADSNQFWTQDSANVEDTSEVNDWFGFALP
ncbi:MAG: FG-GAP repeat protein [Anaerolineales bacterium]